jgi:hypothetical protein
MGLRPTATAVMTAFGRKDTKERIVVGGPQVTRTLKWPVILFRRHQSIRIWSVSSEMNTYLMRIGK